MITRVLYDVRWALRTYLRAPSLTITLLLTLALGVGTTLATFSLVDALLLRPLGGVARPGELVRVAAADDRNELIRVTSAMRDSIRELPAFAGACGLNTPGGVVTVDDRVMFEGLIHVSGDCFAVLGVKPSLGRLLTPEDEQSRATVAVVTYDFWRRELGGSTDVIGQRIGIDGTPYTIVGVAEPEFRGLSTAFPSSVIIPITATPRGSSGSYWADIVARRAPGVSTEQARVQVETAWPQLKQEAGLTAKTAASTRQRLEASRAFVGEMSTGIENVVRSRFEQPLLLTFGLSVLMLAICCVNVANLLAARSIARRSERAIRAALGASSGALWQQLVIEVLLPVLAGVLLAIPLAQVLTVALVDVLRTSYLELDLSAMLDSRVALFLAAIVVILTAFTSGLIHVLSARRQWSLADALHASARTTIGRYGNMRRILVVSQIALTVVLLGSAGRFVSTLQKYYNVDPGFNVESTLAALLLPVPGGPPATDVAYYDDLLTRLEAIPGVQSASVATWMPLGASFSDGVQRVPSAADQTTRASVWSVSDRFFESMGIALKEGQTFRRTIHKDSPAGAATDRTGDSDVGRTAILSESLAKILFPDASAIGGRVRVGVDQNQDATVIGVAADARLAKPQEAQLPVIYLNYWDRPQGSPFLFVRADDDRPGQLAEAVRGEVRAGGRQFPQWVQTMSAHWGTALMQERLLAGTSVAFGVLGLVVAAVGLFGLLSYYVTSRRAEIGIRMALGAGRGDISRLFIREVAVLLVSGCVSGGILLLLTSRIFAGLFFGVVPADAWLLSVAFALIFLVALLSVWVPLRRATSIDPLIALRVE